jgi:hypothetical protein
VAILPPRARRFARIAAWLAIAGVAVWRLEALWAGPPTDFDDAYMYLRYADHLRAGYGLSWNPGGPPVYGITGWLHLLVVLAVRVARPRLSDAEVLRAASLLAAACAVFTLVWICARFARHPGLGGDRLVFAAVLVPLVCFGEAFTFAARSGMDTMSSLAANAGVVFASLRLGERPTRHAALTAAFVSYVALLARPDNAVVAAGCPLLAIVSVGSHRVRRPLLGAFLPTLGGLWALDLVAKRLWLGTALPLSFYAKWPGHYAGFVGEYTWNPFFFLEVFARAVWPLAVALALALGRASARVVAVLLLPVAGTFVALFSVNQIMGHLGRFYLPALPCFVVAAVLAVDRALCEGTLFLPRRLAVGLGVAAAMLLSVPALLEAAGRRYEAGAERQVLAPLGGYAVAAREALPERDSWQSAVAMAELAADLPPGTRIALSEHGLVGARAPQVILIDVLGLHDPAFALRRFSAREMFARTPELIWMPHPDHTQMVRDILDSPELWRDYAFYPDVLTFGVAVRQDREAAVVRTQLETTFRKWYPGRSLAEQRARRVPSE